MFSVIFPGQGSQIVGMGKEFYDKFDLVKNLFKEADDTLNFSISKLILEDMALIEYVFFRLGKTLNSLI